MLKLSLICIILSISIFNCEAVNKYSASANKQVKNVKKTIPESNEIPVPSELRDIEKPYRMAKLNIVWAKAKHVSSQI